MNEQIAELNKIQKKNGEKPIFKLDDEELLKTFLNPEQYAFLIFYEKLEQRALKNLLALLDLVDLRRLTQMQSYVLALAKELAQPEEKSELRRKAEDIIWLIQTVMPMFLKQKPKLEVNK